MGWAWALGQVLQTLEVTTLPRGGLEALLLLGVVAAVGLGCCCCGLAWGLILGQIVPRGWTTVAAKFLLRALQEAEAAEGTRPIQGRAAARLAGYRS